MSEPTGKVEGIFVSPEFERLPESVEQVEIIPGKGIRGDRYFVAEGREGLGEEPGHDLTLIEAEALEALEAEHGIALAPAASRRNVLTRGIRLDDLVGKCFGVGEVECEGVELCEPCNDLEKPTQPGVMRGLVHRAGLRRGPRRGEHPGSGTPSPRSPPPPPEGQAPPASVQ